MEWFVRCRFIRQNCRVKTLQERYYASGIMRLDSSVNIRSERKTLAWFKQRQPGKNSRIIGALEHAHSLQIHNSNHFTESFSTFWQIAIIRMKYEVKVCQGTVIILIWCYRCWWFSMTVHAQWCMMQTARQTARLFYNCTCYVFGRNNV